MRIPFLILIASLAVAGCTNGLLTTKDAEIIKRVEAEYPQYAARDGIEGRVVIEFTIGKDGIPKDVIIVEATPEGVFEASAIAAVNQWRYKPALELGRPAESPEAEAVFNFRLNQRFERKN